MNELYKRVLESDEIIELWPDGAPGSPPSAPEEVFFERGTNGAKGDRVVYNIRRPRIAVLRPPNPNGVAVLVMPGGGFRYLAIDKDAYEIGPWLAEHGFTVFTLLYRLPGEGWDAGPDVALSDAQRAIRIIRHRAASLGVRPDRVVTLGFSAGGHVCADLATRYDRPTYARIDDADALAARPDLAACLYAVQFMSTTHAHEESRALLLGPNPSEALERAHTPAYNVTAQTPPCFLVHAEDDPVVTVDNTLLFRQALKEAGVSVETHLFVRGGHGFGLCVPPTPPSVSWPHLFLSWMIAEGVC